MALVRVGIDTGCGGILSPLFEDGRFEFVPIPGRNGQATYSNVTGRHGRALIEYFRPGSALRARMRDQPMHADPEWRTFTYGDPSRPKTSLRTLAAGDLLVFYAGLCGWGWECPPALYIVGFFDVMLAGFAREFSVTDLHRHWGASAHARNVITAESPLVLVKGSPESRLLEKAAKISSVGQDSAGRPLHVLSPEAQAIFGDFGGKVAIQRSPPRWVAPEFVDRAVRFVRSLR